MSGIEGLLAGRTLVGRYRVEEVIGRGGFAAVYRAVDERLGRTVAVKVITIAASDPGTHEQLRERLQREARAVASLPQHPNVVSVTDVGTDPALGLDFLVMDLLEGEDLARYLDRVKKPPLNLALRILREATRGVGVGHRAGIIHRDVKPGNIFLVQTGEGEPPQVRVLDFGIAQVAAEDATVTRLTQHGSAPLSPAYASPEQLRGERDLTPASDVFSLGVVAYQLLTGERPFGADPDAERPPTWDPERRIREHHPAIATATVAAIRRALMPKPQQRFLDANAFGDALDAASAGRDRDRLPQWAPSTPVAPTDDRTMLAPPRPAVPTPVSPPPPRVSTLPPEPEERSGFPVWLAVLLVAAVALGGWWLFSQGGSARPNLLPQEELPATIVVDSAEPAAPEEPVAASPETPPPAPAPPPEVEIVVPELPEPEVVPVPAPEARPSPPLPREPAPRDTLPPDTMLPGGPVLPGRPIRPDTLVPETAPRPRIEPLR